MERPMTTRELFNKIRDILKEKGMLPDILDYGLATDRPVSIQNCDFELKNNLDYGGSEGIYLDLWMVSFEDGEKKTCGLGIFKTLDSSGEAMHIMAGLLADFIIEATSYVNRNLDDFTWEGADVRAIDGNGKALDWCYSCGSMEKALKKKDELLERYPEVTVRDNATRKVEVFRRDGKERKEGWMEMESEGMRKERAGVMGQQDGTVHVGTCSGKGPEGYGELFVFVPEVGQIVRIAEGTGDNLLREDEEDGYVDYIYYEQHELGIDMPVVDGGQVLLEGMFRELFQSTADCIPRVLDMAYGTDTLGCTILA